jgi:hypothetical protein
LAIFSGSRCRIPQCRDVSGKLADGLTLGIIKGSRLPGLEALELGL